MVQVVTGRGPSLAELRPLETAPRPRESAGFPVYDALARRLREPETDPSSGRPDAVTAHVLAVLSTYAYSELSTVLEMAARLGLERAYGVQVRFVNDAQLIASTAYLLQSEDGSVGVLAYRGTEPVNVLSWLTDIDVSPERVDLSGESDGEGEELAVHAGFYRNVRATRFKIAEALLAATEGRPVTQVGHGPEPPEMVRPLRALYVTGHSLGGAMAALMAVLLREDPRYWDRFGGVLRALYTFGQPMVGSPGLARSYDDDEVGRRTFRYVYEGDPVPRLPPRDTGSWAHFGHELRHVTRLTTRGWTGRGRPVGQIRLAGQVLVALGSFPLSQLLVLNRVPFQYRIDDHRPNHYVAELTPEGVVSEFGDFLYRTDVSCATRLRRQVEDDLRRLCELVP